MIIFCVFLGLKLNIWTIDCCWEVFCCTNWAQTPFWSYFFLLSKNLFNFSFGVENHTFKNTVLYITSSYLLISLLISLKYMQDLRAGQIILSPFHVCLPNTWFSLRNYPIFKLCYFCIKKKIIVPFFCETCVIGNLKYFSLYILIYIYIFFIFTYWLIIVSIWTRQGRPRW